MKKAVSSFVCQECGYDTPSWLGKCPECGSWNSLKEIKIAPVAGGGSQGISPVASVAKPLKLKEIAYTEKSRIQTNYQELNTVLGGGIVQGSVILMAGDPGVGKSTLLLQLALGLASGSAGSKNGHPPRTARRVLYVSGEESVEQIKMRADRIIESTRITNGQKTLDTPGTLDTPDTLYLVSMSDADAIVRQIEEMKPDLVVIDSIQTIESQNVSGLSGSVAQVRYAALQFVRIAKSFNIPIVIVGHVTKEGMVAGPMVLSHMVDTVLFLEGEKFVKTRILRSLKNRFGPVDEVGIFLMEEEGIVEATNPEQLFFTAGNIQTPGSVLAATLEGSRAFLVEIQALIVYSKLPMPRRVVSGVDPRRVELLLAVLQKHCKQPVDTMDVFINVAGGIRLTDPGIDLAICLAVYSSISNISLTKTVGIAEVGLLGELRMVQGLEKRIREAQKLGLKQIISAKDTKSLKKVIETLK